MSTGRPRQKLPPPSQRNCWFGKRCHRPGCPFAHPNDEATTPSTTTPTSELSSSSPSPAPSYFQPVQPQSLQKQQQAVQAPQQQNDVDLFRWTKRLEEQTGMTHIPFAAELEECRASNVTSYLNHSAVGRGKASKKPKNSTTASKNEPERKPFRQHLVHENVFVPASVQAKAAKKNTTTSSKKKLHSIDKGMSSRAETAPSSSPNFQQIPRNVNASSLSTSCRSRNRSRGRRHGEKANAVVEASHPSGPAALQHATPTHAPSYSSTNNDTFVKETAKQQAPVVQQPQRAALYETSGGNGVGNRRATPATSQQLLKNGNVTKSGNGKVIPKEIEVLATVSFAQQPESKSPTQQPRESTKKASSNSVPLSTQQQQQQEQQKRLGTESPVDPSFETNATTTMFLQAVPTNQEDEQEQLARALAESLHLAEYYQAQQDMTSGQLERFEMAPEELKKFKEQRKAAKKARRKKQQQEGVSNQVNASDASSSHCVQSGQEGRQSPQQAKETKDNDSSSAIIKEAPPAAVIANTADKASAMPANDQDEQEQLARAIAESLRLTNSSDQSAGELKQGQAARLDMSPEELEAYKKQRKAAKKSRRKQQQQADETAQKTNSDLSYVGEKDSSGTVARAHSNIATSRTSSLVGIDNPDEEEEMTEEEKKRRRMEQFRIQQENAVRKKSEQKEKRRQEFLREQESQANERKRFWQDLIDQEVKAVQLTVELCAAEFCRKNVQVTSHCLIELERERLTAASQKAYHKLFPQPEVVVKGVTGDLKDRTGTIEYFDEQTQKFVVTLDSKKGKKKFSTHVLPENLELTHHGRGDNKKTPKVAVINMSSLHGTQGLHFELEKHLLEELLHAERPQDVVNRFVFQRHQQEAEEQRIREEMKFQEEEERQRRAEQRRREEEEYAERRRQYQERKQAYEEARRQAKRKSNRRQQHSEERCHCPQCEFMRMFTGGRGGGPFGSGFGPRVFFTKDGIAFGFDDDDDYDTTTTTITIITTSFSMKWKMKTASRRMKRLLLCWRLTLMLGQPRSKSNTTNLLESITPINTPPISTMMVKPRNKQKNTSSMFEMLTTI